MHQATNLDTKETFKTTSSSDGSYGLSGLPAGNYEISVENMFPCLPFHQGGLRVAGGETTRVDIRLDDVNLNTLGDGGEQFAQALSDKPVVSGPAPRVSNGKPDLIDSRERLNANSSMRSLQSIMQRVYRS